MIKNDDILSILKKSDDDKIALLENVLLAVQKAETVFEAKKSKADELKEHSAAAEEDIIKLLNGHIRRLETEKIELSMEVETARDDLEQIDVIRARVLESESALEKANVQIELVTQEKTEANEKLVKIQAQWEKIAGN